MKKVRNMIGTAVALAPAVALVAPGTAMAAAKPNVTPAKAKTVRSMRPAVTATCTGEAPVSAANAHVQMGAYYTHHPSGHPNSDCIGTAHGNYSGTIAASAMRYRVRNAANQIKYQAYVTGSRGCSGSGFCYDITTDVIRQTFSDPVQLCVAPVYNNHTSVPGTSAACLKVN